MIFGASPGTRPRGNFFMRIGFYIDGFNVYGAINDIVFKRGKGARYARPHYLKWLSYTSLCNSIATRVGQKFDARPNVVAVHFFTTVPEPIYDAQGKIENAGVRSRHQDFVQALEAEGVRVHHGKFKALPLQHCKDCDGPVTQCGAGHILKPKLSEKETDVNLAVLMVADAVAGKVDCVVILSTDSDIAPAARLIHSETDVKVVSGAVHPRRHSKAILASCDFHLMLSEKILREHLLSTSLMGRF